MAHAEFQCIINGGHLASVHSSGRPGPARRADHRQHRWIGYHDRVAEAGCTDDRHQGIGGTFRPPLRLD